MLSSLDYLVAGLFLILIVSIGVLSSRKNSTSEDYFVAGRSLSWFPIAVSIAATMISANGFMGGPGWAYKDGLLPFMINITVPLSAFFVIYTTVPVCYRLKLTSIYEYVELRLGKRTHLITTLCFFANAIIQIGSMVFIPSLIINFFTGWNIMYVIPIVVVIAILYTLLGGIRAVIWTDVCQMMVMWCGLAAIVYISVVALDGDVLDIFSRAKLSGKLFSLDFSFNMSSSTTFWASLIGGFVMWTNYFGFNQVQMQRVLTAKSIDDCKRSMVNSALIMNVMYFIFMIVGILIFLLYNGRSFPNANSIMLEFISDYLPKGIVGLVIAGVIAASMSSVDSLLNSMTTVFTKDIYEKYISREKGDASLRTSMLISMCFGLLISVVSIMAFSQSTKSILDLVGSYIAYISGPMAAIYFLSFFTLTANDKGVSTGSIAGFLLTIFICSKVQLGWIWRPALGFAVSSLLGYFFSLLWSSEESREKARTYTISGIARELSSSELPSQTIKSLMPLNFDKYCWISTVFFLLQYVLLGWLMFS